MAPERADRRAAASGSADVDRPESERAAATGSGDQVAEQRTVAARVEGAVPVGVRIAGAWSWRALVVAAVIAVVIYLVGLLHTVVVPVAVAILLAGLLTPVKNRLRRIGLPKWLSVLIVFLGTLVVIAGLIVLVVFAFRAGLSGSGLTTFQSRLERTYSSLLGVLKPLGISQSDVKSSVAGLGTTLQKNESKILSGALTGVSTLGDVAVGLLIALFTTLFLLIDGPGIWRWCLRLAPIRARAGVDGAGRAAWLSISEYVRVQVLVALLDAIGIGLVAFLLHLPFVIPITVLVFLAAFIPIVGAVTTGFLAVLVALVYDDPVSALIMLAGVIGVNQLESHVLQPLLMGGAVRLHPIAVVLSVALGSLLGGIPGAVFAVPFAAALNSSVKYLAGGQWKGQPPPSTARVPEGADADPTARRDRNPRPKDVKTVA